MMLQLALHLESLMKICGSVCCPPDGVWRKKLYLTVRRDLPLRYRPFPSPPFKEALVGHAAPEKTKMILHCGETEGLWLPGQGPILLKIGSYFGSLLFKVKTVNRWIEPHYYSASLADPRH